MGLCLIAFSMTAVGGVLLAAAGLGFVIFVHELGHFAVARMCGVKCEKFMVGFDFGGLKLSRKWGETEYGIGIFPLGGYVKMFGQDDDPSKIVEQMEASQVEGDSSLAKEMVGPDGKKRMVDRRSYQAKSVPQRMAIISAGVIMNMIFAFVFAFIAFGLGVDYAPCVISHTSPGAPAWQAGLETGDEIIQIGERKNPAFEHLMSSVTLSDMEAGVQFRIRRVATGSEEDLLLHPVIIDGFAKIGMGPGRTNELHPLQAAISGTVAAKSAQPFKPADKIVAVNGTPVDSYRDVMSQLVIHAREKIDVTVERSTDNGESGEKKEQLTIAVDPTPARRLGMVMTIGPITAIQTGSPAEQAGLKPGDQIVAIDGKSIGSAAPGEASLDPATLGDVLASSQEPVTLSVIRAGADANVDASAEPEQISITPRPVTWLEEAGGIGTPMPLPALGLTYSIRAEVESVIASAPAAEAGVQPGDQVTAVILSWPPTEGEDERTTKEIELDEPDAWPSVYHSIRHLPEGGEVTLKIKRGEESQELKMAPVVLDDSFVVQRGFAYSLLERTREINSVGEQFSYAWDRTKFSLTTVLRFIRKLAAQQVPADKLGGPLQILNLAYKIANVGWAPFLLFLTMLSANLAVLNFLPIPVLDGGHMVFLAWEGITGKPANEKLIITLHLIGMALLLSLMIYVTHNDIINLFFSS